MIPFAGCFSRERRQAGRGDLVFVGLPADSRSSFRRGASQGPEAVRSAYDGRCFNSCCESGADLAGRVLDAGDWVPGQAWDEARESYRRSAAEVLERGALPFFVGGDHAVTPPLAEALAVLGAPVHVMQLDAHPDLYPEYDGDPHSHACAASRLLQMDHIASLTQIGVRAFDRVQRDAARQAGDRLRIHEARTLRGSLPFPEAIPRDALVYITLDIDVLDPAFAPGVSHPVPGGLSTRQVLDWLRGLPWRLAGMDLVEVNPSRDLNSQTAIAAGRLLHEAMGRALGSWASRK